MITYMEDELHGVILTTILVAIISFCTSTLFLSVLSATAGKNEYFNFI
jgi:hypothetical protein